MKEPARKLTPSEFLAELKRQVAEKPLLDDGPPEAEFADLDFSDLSDLPARTGDRDAPGPGRNGTATKSPSQRAGTVTDSPARDRSPLWENGAALRLSEPQRDKTTAAGRKPAPADRVKSPASKRGTAARTHESSPPIDSPEPNSEQASPAAVAAAAPPVEAPVERDESPAPAHVEERIAEAAEPGIELPEEISDHSPEQGADTAESASDPSVEAATLDEPVVESSVEEPLAEEPAEVPGADAAAGEEEEFGSENESESEDEVARNLRKNPHLSALFERVNQLLGGSAASSDEPFRPRAVETLYETGMTAEEIERLILKYLLARGEATGRQIAAQICLPFQIVDPLLRQLKQEQIVAFVGAAEMGDYQFTITERGRERARAYVQECSYFGSCPVPLRDYLRAMEAQSVARQQATEEDLREAFSDLIIPQALLDRLGPAVNSGRGMFLFGEPGNGKTSIAERITRCFGSTIWIPRALGIDGDIIRVYDPGVHEIVEENTQGGIFDLSGVDQRWVRIVRPTVIAGGELTMSELEVTQNKQTKICEAPLQLKSNCGTLVIDDFGRQTMPTDVLLNRWIVPLEKRFDYLNLPSGKKVQVPFDQLIIFSTNLEPKDLVDDAFLRRIPYKIEVPDPDRELFVSLFERMCPLMGFQYDAKAVEYLVDKHYIAAERPFRACQPRDLLLQVKNYCTYKKIPRKLTPEAFDLAVENYFSVM